MLVAGKGRVELGHQLQGCHQAGRQPAAPPSGKGGAHHPPDSPMKPQHSGSAHAPRSHLCSAGSRLNAFSPRLPLQTC